MESVADLKLTLLLLFAAIISLVLVPSAQATTTDVKYCGQFHFFFLSLLLRTILSISWAIEIFNSYMLKGFQIFAFIWVLSISL